ncbi:MAG: hypothetical protein ACK4IK_08435 [Bacteroidia bacterium]
MNWSNEKRLIYLTKISYIFLLIGIVISLKLWLSNRYFPLVPLINFIPSFTAPFDGILLFIFILSTFIRLLFSNLKSAKIIFWISITALLITDINRMQPWVYCYLLILFFIDFVNSEYNKLNIIKTLFAVIYFYSGWHKLNPEYFNSVINWFAEPFLNNKNLLYNVFYIIGSAIPLIEMSIAIALFSGRYINLAIYSATFIHLFILFSIGPFGHKYNAVIWPWNVFIPIALFLIFRQSNNENIFQHIKNQIKFKSKYDYILLYIIISPLLNSINWFPSYLSWNLYSGNTEKAYLYLGENVNNFFSPDFDDIVKDCYDAPYTLNLKKWALKELNVPPFPEKPVWHKCREHMFRYTENENEVILSIQPKTSIWGKKDAIIY